MWIAEEWNFARDMNSEGPNWQDERHVRFTYDLAMACDFRTVLEIGVDTGWSTTAWLQAIKEGKRCSLHLCDIHLQDCFNELLAKHGPPEDKRQISIYQCDSVALRWVFNWLKTFDVVVMDGDHSLQQVSRELGLLLYHEVKTIIAHDTSGTMHKPAHERGPVFLRETLANYGYLMRHDEKRRSGEHTHRGFTMFTRDIDVWNRSESIWEEMLK